MKNYEELYELAETAWDTTYAGFMPAFSSLSDDDRKKLILFTRRLKEMLDERPTVDELVDEFVGSLENRD